jgi:hypothetical protein
MSVLVDVCRAIGAENNRDVAAKLDADEKDYVDIADAMGRMRQTSIVSRPGLTKVLRESKKQAAKAAADRFDRRVRLLLRLAHLDANELAVEPNHILRIIQQSVRHRVSIRFGLASARH